MVKDDEEQIEKIFLSHLVMTPEQRTQSLLDARRDGIVLNKFIAYVMKKYLERDKNVLELLYKYVQDKKTKNSMSKHNSLKKYHSIITEYEKIYFPSEDDIELDVDTTIYGNVTDMK